MPKSRDGSILLVLSPRQQQWLESQIDNELEFFRKLDDLTTDETLTLKEVECLNSQLSAAVKYQRK